MPETRDIGADLDLRLVLCFVAVADHRHLGRAATALHLAQPPLSRQIRRLEEQLGARLLDRGPHGTELTEAGSVFLPRARALLRSAGRAAAEVRAAARPTRLTVGRTTALIITPAVREVRRRHPDAEVHTLPLGWNEPRQALLDHRVDAVVARMPFPTDGLHVTILRDKPRVLLVPADHRLAGRESVTLDDIAGEPTPRLPDPVWNAFWRIDPRPDGSRAPDGPLVETVEDRLELIAGGDAVAIAPAGSFAVHTRPDIAVVPLEGVEPAHVVPGLPRGRPQPAGHRRADGRNRLVTAFRRAARTCLTGSPAPDRGCPAGSGRTSLK